MSSEDNEKISKELELLRTYRDTLTTCCEKLDLLEFSDGLCKHRIITVSVKEDFNSIDGERVDLSLRVRYILKIVFDKIRHDKVFFPALLKALIGCGGRELKSVCDILNKEYLKHQKIPSGSVGEVVQDPEIPLTENDIPYLVDPLASVAHKWEEISIGLRIPLATTEEIKRDVGSFVIKLNKVLHGWVSGGYLKPVTLDTLKRVLAKEMVGLSSVAETLSLEDPLPASNNPHMNKCYDRDLRILYQLREVCVAYGKSTLLEVQVTNASSSVSYQWSKDGCEISDGDNYQGARSSILLVCHRNMSSKHIEGKYVCQVEGKVSSEEIQLEICYPDRIKHILDGYKKLEAVPKDSWPPRRAESL